MQGVDVKKNSAAMNYLIVSVNTNNNAIILKELKYEDANSVVMLDKFPLEMLLNNKKLQWQTSAHISKVR